MWPHNSYMDIEANQKSKEELINLIKDETAILMAGAGISKWSEYPLWKELINNMASELAPEVVIEHDADYAFKAQEIKQTLADKGLPNDYSQYIKRTFSGNGHSPSSIHNNLACLPFKALVTTNYDPMLEVAISHKIAPNIRNNPSVNSDYYCCKPIDLCSWGNQVDDIMEFIRDFVKPKRITDRVLHLHGFYKQSREAITTYDDYLEKYGMRGTELIENIRSELKEKKVKRQQELERILCSNALDTEHRKILWLLLALSPIVFIGFSLKSDPFFRRILQIIREDFGRPKKPNYILLGYKKEKNGTLTVEGDNIEIIEKELKEDNIIPVFYEIIVNSKGDEDHVKLNELISEIRNETEKQNGVNVAKTKAKKKQKRKKSGVKKSKQANKIARSFSKKMIKLKQSQ